MGEALAGSGLPDQRHTIQTATRHEFSRQTYGHHQLSGAGLQSYFIHIISQPPAYDCQISASTAAFHSAAWRVQVQGGATPEYHVIVNPARLQAFHMTLSDVAQSLSAANVLSAVGKFEDHDKLYLIISNTSYRSIRQIQQVVLRTGANGLVRLGDVATVKLSTRPQWTRVDADGHPAVLLQIFQQPGGNTVRIARDIRRKMDGFKKIFLRVLKLRRGTTKASLFWLPRLRFAMR